MSENKVLTDEIIAFCDKISIDLVGFGDPKHFNRFTKENRPESYLKNSKTVIIIGFYLYDINLDAWSKDESKGKSYHFTDSILLTQCHQIKVFLAKQGYQSKIIPYKPGLYLKDAAALAGIGPIGKNNLLITTKYGSQVRLRAITTNASLICGTPILESEYCEDCELCINACPANAFQGGKYDKVACFTYCLANLQNLSDETVIWCNICIEACPIRKK